MDSVPQSTIDHFAAMPWVKSVLDDLDFKAYSQSRTVTDDGKGHTLMGKTWNTDSTIKEILTLVRRSRSSEPLVFPQSEAERPETRRFYTFGGDLTAHPGLLHGGVISCILDSSLGGIIGFALANMQDGLPQFTVSLHVTFKAPVRTPGTVMVRAWVTKMEDRGRKAWAAGQIESEDGTVHATAEGMWLRVRPKAKI